MATDHYGYYNNLIHPVGDKIKESLEVSNEGILSEKNSFESSSPLAFKDDETTLTADIKYSLYRRLPCLIRFPGNIPHQNNKYSPKSKSSFGFDNPCYVINDEEGDRFPTESKDIPSKQYHGRNIRQNDCEIENPNNNTNVLSNILRRITLETTSTPTQQVEDEREAAGGNVKKEMLSSNGCVLLYSSIECRKIFGKCSFENPFHNSNQKSIDILIPETYTGWFRIEDTDEPRPKSALCYSSVSELCHVKSKTFLSVVDIMGYYLLNHQDLVVENTEEPLQPNHKDLNFNFNEAGIFKCTQKNSTERSISQTIDYCGLRSHLENFTRNLKMDAKKFHCKKSNNLSKFYKYVVPRGTVLKNLGIFYEAESTRVKQNCTVVSAQEGNKLNCTSTNKKYYKQQQTNISPLPNKLISGRSPTSGGGDPQTTAVRYMKCEIIESSSVKTSVALLPKTVFIPLHRTGKFYLIDGENQEEDSCCGGVEDLSTEYVYSIQDIIRLISHSDISNKIGKKVSFAPNLLTSSSPTSVNTAADTNNNNRFESLKFRHVFGPLPSTLFNTLPFKECLSFTLQPDIEYHESLLACVSLSSGSTSSNDSNSNKAFKLIEIDMEDSRDLLESEAEIIIDNRTNSKSRRGGFSNAHDEFHKLYSKYLTFCDDNAEDFYKSIKLIHYI